MTPKEKAREKRLYNTYGLTGEDWADMFDMQQHVCFICRTMPKSGVLCVDHIHVKGFKTMKPEEKKKHVRGLLCFMCNTALKAVEKTANGVRNRSMLDGITNYFRIFRLKGEEA